MPSMLVAAEINLNLLRPNSNVVVYAKQYDKAARIININLLAGAEVWDPPSNAEAIVMYIKPDGTSGAYDTLEDSYIPVNPEPGDNPASEGWYEFADHEYIPTTDTTVVEGKTYYDKVASDIPAIETLGAGRIRLNMAQQMLTAVGNVGVQISFITSDMRATTLSFVISVEKGTPDDETILSSDYYNILTSMVQGVLEAASNPPIIDPNTSTWLLWDQEHNQYEDSGLPSRGIQGPAGVITVVPEVKYSESTSGTVVPTNWSTAKPTVPQGSYLWVWLRLEFGDGTYADTYTTNYQSIDGKAVNSLVEVSAPHTAGQMDTYKFVYTDGTYTQNFQVYNGRDGDMAYVTLGSVSLPTASWVANIGYYSQVCTMQYATIDEYSKVDVQPNASVISQMITDGTYSLYIENNGGILSAIAVGGRPSVDITLQCAITEVV